MAVADLSGQAVTLFCCLLSLYVFRIITTYAKLMQFRGPSGTGISNWPHSMAMLRGNCHEWYAEVNKKHGPIARVAPQVLVTSSPEVWMHVNNKPGYKRSNWYYKAARIEYRRDNVFSQTDNTKHEQRRKQMAPGYSGRENIQLEGSIDERLQDFLEEGLAIGNTALAMGFSWITQMPFIGRFIAPSPKDSNGFGKMMAACFRLVEERAAGSTDEKSDMLASFMRHGLAGDELRTEALEQIIAGSDTTAGAIRGTLLYLITNPRVYLKLQYEIDDATRRGFAPSKDESLITAAQARNLPYLQAVIREALRVCPPVTNVFPRDIPPDGDALIVDGESVLLPGGACIGYSAYAMHQSEKIYGKDAEAFRPERWLESNPAKLAVMVRTNELIFGHGRFQCLGKAVAQIEIGKTVFELLRNFDLALISPTHPWDARNYLGLFAISNMWVQVMERMPCSP
ncbi:hypothetical protein PENARI_c081G00866 [Penicillium arizonense]|uniref:Uncharacterized protein n=1 Tax=Penicillium arizonense TaxID=1835702 RepID=A0A1F5L1P7_PENAI|nr:hypothetical protein PENARI_c081G00866 [Penicillium arizonense]OGE46976.1 hypothetical protein PENARI_c081G00866 [Penicillium arizonense]